MGGFFRWSFYLTWACLARLGNLFHLVSNAGNVGVCQAGFDCGRDLFPQSLNLKVFLIFTLFFIFEGEFRQLYSAFINVAHIYHDKLLPLWSDRRNKLNME